MLFLNEERECVFDDNLPNMIIGGNAIGPFEMGTPTMLPNWIIEKLMAKGLVKLEKSTRRKDELHRFHQEEMRSPKMVDLPPLLYATVIRYLQRIQSDKTALDQRIDNEIDDTKNMLESIIKVRMPKLMRVAMDRGAFLDKRGLMTLEERWLMEHLMDLISSWEKTITERI
jgi:hypothetical protein